MSGKARALAADAAMLVVYFVVSNPAVTGVPAHEWLGLGVVLALLLHASSRFARVIGARRRSVAGAAAACGSGRLALDALLLAALATCAVSGLMVSGAVLPALGVYATGYYFWDPLHAVSAKLLLALLLVHLVLNWKVVAKALRRKGPDHGE